ncbi:ribonuclease P protein component [Bacteroidales bacterium OttesenSCG-928-L14]|nr:ribonuclease P protein component [Bacteroidales bacterium OttesenSCG-928-L14]
MISERKFPKKERLRNETLIAELFKKGKRFYYDGFVFIRLFYNNPYPENLKKFSNIQFFSTVRKKEFKSAVKRNRIRRLLKESYRNNKHLLRELKFEDNKILLLGVLYVGKEIPTYNECNEKMLSFINNILK